VSVLRVQRLDGGGDIRRAPPWPVVWRWSSEIFGRAGLRLAPRQRIDDMMALRGPMEKGDD
jgi:hypothetical protein